MTKPGMNPNGEIHSWNVSPREAIALQKELAPRIIREGKVGDIRRVAGCDIASSIYSRRAAAGVVVLSFPELEVIEEVTVEGEVPFPYVPGLLTFREGPLALRAFSRLMNRPDVVFFDGQGIAHPRRFGLASHLGLWLGLPSVGCAKSRYLGEYREPGRGRGKWSELLDAGEVIGAVLRTKDGVNPVFVSIGHRLDLEEAVRITLAVDGGYRIPQPTRLAHQLVSGR